MSLVSYVSGQEHQKLLEHFGTQKIDRVSRILATYINRWHLAEIKLIPYYSVNILFSVQLLDGQPAILKIHSQVDRYTTREISMLQRGLPLYCRLINFSEEDGVLLLQKGEGASLHHIDDLYSRLDVFVKVFKSIHLSINQDSLAQAVYPTYLELLHNIENWAKHNESNALLPYIDEALVIYDELQAIYPNKYVLHGDLHHDNIIYLEQNTPIVIDPKGVIESELFDVPRFILNEFTDDVIDSDVEKIVNTIKYLSYKLNLPAQHIAKVLCIESILSVTWTLQDSEQGVDVDKYINQHLFMRQFIDMFS